MKKYLYIAVAAIAALSSCSGDIDPVIDAPGQHTLTFTATMEGSPVSRATYDSDYKCAAWEVDDQISINGKTYSAKTAGPISTFKAVGGAAAGTTYKAYFPANLCDGTTATLPVVQTYTAGKFDMPMYAESTTTTLDFKNLCAVLAIKVTSNDIPTLKSIKVASDKMMSGTFTVTDNKAVIDDYGPKAVVLESSTALSLTPEGTTFYIAIPAQEYQYLNIFLSSDGETYTQAMATKSASGLGEIARSNMFEIEYEKNAVKLWAGNLFVADCNIGATSATEYGGHYTWGGSQDKGNEYNTGSESLSGDNDTATKLWGSNWRMPTSDELNSLMNLGTSWDGVNKGLQCTSTIYTGNSVFLPASGDSDTSGEVRFQDTHGFYWSSAPYLIPTYASCLSINESHNKVSGSDRAFGNSVRAVLTEASINPDIPTTGTAKATINGSEVDVNWVQLWAGGPKFADRNVEGSMSFTEATDANFIWGANWCTPSKDDMEELLKAATRDYKDEAKVTCTYVNEGASYGFKFTGREDGYTSNTLFLPADYAADQWGGSVYYWSRTEANDGLAWKMQLNYLYGWYSGWYSESQDYTLYVRPVLKE